MRNTCLFLASSLLAFAQADFAAKADAHVKAYLEQGRFQGSVLVAKGGKTLLLKGYGFANEEHEVLNKPNTKFRLGSITKQFTAVSILQLQEQGKLNVQDPISKYIPNSPDAWKAVTVRHLLNHTSGIPSYTNVPEYSKRMREEVTPLTFLDRFRNKPLDFEPGSKYAYNNSGYFLLGVIVEQLSGMSYEKYLRQNIFDKLDMQDSGYDWDSTILKNRAAGYSRDKEGKLRNAEYLDMGQPYAAGSLYSTVEDLYRWDRALYTEKILSRKSLEEAWTPGLSDYGYGWTIKKDPKGRKTIAHAGGINGFTTMMIRVPEEDAFVAIFSNLQSPDTGRIGNELVQLLFGETVPAPVARKVASVPSEVLQRYTGKYQLGPMTFTVNLDKTFLMVEVTGQGSIAFYPESEAKVFAKAADVQLTFGNVENGKAQTLTLHQGGRDQVAKRLPN